MKALFISDDPSLFDPASAVRARMRAYARAIGDLHIVSRSRSILPEMHESGLHIYPVRASKLFGTRALAKRARALILANGIEVVSAQDPFEHGLAARMAVRGSDAALHLQVHTDFLSPWYARESWKNRLRVRIADKILPQAAGIRVVSERVRQSLLARYGARITEPSVIPIAVPMPEGPPAPLPSAPNGATFSILTVGRLEPEKRIGDLLVALSRVLVRYPKTALYVTGTGREKERLAAQARALGLEDAVVWLGARADAVALMGSASAYAQASSYEGYGRTLVEAALMRMPIVTTDVGIVGDVLKPDRDVLAVPVGDPQAIAIALLRLIEDNHLRENLASEAAHTAHNHLMANVDQPGAVAEDLARAARSRATVSTL
jgi:glycosyltransferase involved in cell wall biosynthesis